MLLDTVISMDEEELRGYFDRLEKLLLMIIAASIGEEVMYCHGTSQCYINLLKHFLGVQRFEELNCYTRVKKHTMKNLIMNISDDETNRLINFLEKAFNEIVQMTLKGEEYFTYGYEVKNIGGNFNE